MSRKSNAVILEKRGFSPEEIESLTPRQVAEHLLDWHYGNGNADYIFEVLRDSGILPTLETTLEFAKEWYTGFSDAEAEESKERIIGLAHTIYRRFAGESNDCPHSDDTFKTPMPGWVVMATKNLCDTFNVGGFSYRGGVEDEFYPADKTEIAGIIFSAYNNQSVKEAKK